MNVSRVGESATGQGIAEPGTQTSSQEFSRLAGCSSQTALMHPQPQTQGQEADLPLTQVPLQSCDAVGQAGQACTEFFLVWSARTLSGIE